MSDGMGFVHEPGWWDAWRSFVFHALLVQQKSSWALMLDVGTYR
jgi:hypothetical protein